MPPSPFIEDQINFLDDSDLTIRDVDESFHSCVSTPPRRTSVRFQADADVYTVQSLADYSPDEIRRCWYSRDEFHTIKQSCLTTIQIMNTCCFVEDERICYRGFESRKGGKDAAKSRSLNRLNAEKAVLIEQDRQRMFGMANPELISKVYSDCTMSSSLEAHKIAIDDYLSAHSPETIIGIQPISTLFQPAPIAKTISSILTIFFQSPNAV